MDNSTNPVQQPQPAAAPKASHRQFIMLISSAIILLGAIGLIVSKNNTKTTQPTSVISPTSQTATASSAISGNGFTPQTISIKPNTELTWTNNDSAAHQVSADPYPLNNSIAGFDSNQLLEKGDSYSFTFQKSGTYHVHDNLNPLKFNQTIIVK